MAADVVGEKRELRRLARERLARMTVEARAQQSERICGWLTPRVATGTILGFAPLPEEVDLWPLLATIARAGRLVLPRVLVDGSLSLHRVPNLEALRAGPWGLREPPEGNTPVSAELLDVVLVPGLVFSDAGDRLGRGRGMFDRLLASLGPDVRTIGVAFAEQREPFVPTEPHDVRCRELVPTFA